MSRRIVARWTCSIALVLNARSANGQRVVYVDSKATGKNDGTVWADAYRDLQDALDDARNNGGSPCEVWVAAGVYKPDRGTGDRTMSFQLVSGVGLYGGFAGGETSYDQRNPGLNETVLSGDINGDDDPSRFYQSNCCYETGLPGCDDVECTERVVSEGGPPRNCALKWENTFFCPVLALQLCCDVCRPTRCENSLHVVRATGTDASALLDGFTVLGGEADGLDNPAGGLRIIDGIATIANCVFRDNAGSWGAAIEGEGFTITNSLFTNNFPYGNGSVVDAFLFDEQESVHLEDCTFYGNEGGVLVDGQGSATVRRCRFVANNVITSRAAGISASNGRITVEDSLFLRNRDGALKVEWGTQAVISRCRFIGNTHESSAAGVENDGYAVVSDSIFLGNRSGEGKSIGWVGAFNNDLPAFARIDHCTFVANESDQWGGLAAWGGAYVTNSVFWGNLGTDGPVESAQVLMNVLNFPTSTINHSIVQNWTGLYGGVGNSGADPMFVDPLGRDGIAGTEDDDLRLQPGSPAIDAGASYSGMSSTDLDGYPRVLCDRPDIGAYEFGIGDFNCDRTVDLWDFSAWPYCATGPIVGPPAPMCQAFDFDANRAIDLFDFAQFDTIAFPHRRPPHNHHALDPQ